ncbi:unnamed protein product [Linum trigynum]|uniref:F-box domain-containing protein n=1 Tax=Linum trigynum TaxID=586398 RepID=A0AAV2F6E7_9ROSI
MTNKRRKRTTSPAVVPCEDRISALPDEVLHCIIRRLESHRQLAQTTAISNRWRNLWRSYPVVEFDADWQTKNSSIRSNKYLENFCATAINKFSQHKEFFRIETSRYRLDSTTTSAAAPLFSNGYWILRGRGNSKSSPSSLSARTTQTNTPSPYPSEDLSSRRPLLPEKIPSYTCF